MDLQEFLNRLSELIASAQAPPSEPETPPSEPETPPQDEPEGATIIPTETEPTQIDAPIIDDIPPTNPDTITGESLDTRFAEFYARLDAFETMLANQAAEIVKFSAYIENVEEAIGAAANLTEEAATFENLINKV